jgi:thiol-disulfide isomerase/thioredoxin
MLKSRKFYIGVFAGIFLTLLIEAGLIFWIFLYNRESDLASVMESPPISLNEEVKGNFTSFISGKDIEIEKGKVYFVNFWATWCQPCLVEMPSIQNLRENLSDYPVEFILATQEDKTKLEKFLEKDRNKKYDSRMFFLFNDASISQHFHGGSIPRTYIVKNGEIVFQHTGMAKWDDPDFMKFLKSQIN